MRARVLAAAVLVLAVGAASRADDKPLDRTDLDKRIVQSVYRSALLGTDVFNKGKHEECFRLYQGTLLAVQPLLDHRPKLAASVKEKMDKAGTMEPAKGAFVLRDALDEIQYEIAPGAKPDPKDMKDTKKTTLWDRLGGETGVSKVVTDILAVAIEEPKVNFLRNGKYKLDGKGIADLRQKMVDMVSEATGGPLKYKGKDMKSAHAGMKITEQEFDALAEIVQTQLKKNKVADADVAELMKIIGATKKDIVEGKGM